MNDEHLTAVERLIKQTKGAPPRLLIVIAGPSGVGKNTIIKKLLAKHEAVMDRVRTYTTREPRDGEVEGEQYHFVTRDQFYDMAQQNLLMEPDGQDVYGLGDVYSMPADLFEEIEPGKHVVIAEVDIHGTRRIRERYPDAVTIFLTATPDVLIERISERPDDHLDREALARRLDTAKEQFEAAKEYDYIVYNLTGRQAQALKVVESIVNAERSRVRPGADLAAVIPADAFELSTYSTQN